MNQRITAINTGIALLLMAILGGYSLGFALPNFYPLDNSSQYIQKIKEAYELYQNMLYCIGIVLMLDLVVSYTTYLFFKATNKKIALISGVLRVVYTVFFFIATLYLIKNTSLENLTNEQIQVNFKTFYDIWNSGLVLFGIHVFLLGILMRAIGIIPSYLWYTTLFAGVCYTLLHLLKLIPNCQDMADTLVPFLALPMALGEIGVAIWLLFKGGKNQKQAN
ncbi:MAG: DUF4386 domain-containing protein [Flavicella sp.]